jgi:ATP synthase protein I
MAGCGRTRLSIHPKPIQGATLNNVADDDNNSKPRGTSDFIKVESMVQLAIALPAACLIGWGAGALIDKHFGTGYWGLVGIGVGAVAGFVQIFTTASRILNKGK